MSDGQLNFTESWNIVSFRHRPSIPLFQPPRLVNLNTDTRIRVLDAQTKETMR
jgi:hypothetical protein